MGSSRLAERRTRPHGAGAGAVDAVGHLCAAVFDTLPRADQRRKAELYVRGLLTAPGRKSMRSIAAHAGMAAGEQSLHHFISCSTWDWQSVREALAVYLDRTAGLRAWVVKPMVIPKSGAHTVGVERRFDARLGQMVNGQQAFGAWAVGDEVTAPVGWSLHLPAESTLADCAARSVLDLAGPGTLRRLPVVLDAVQGGAEELPQQFAAAGLPFVMRIGGSTPVTVIDPHLPGIGRTRNRAGTVMEAARMLRRPVRYPDGVDGSVRTAFTAAVRVETATRAGGAARPLMLLAEWSDPRRRPDRILLTDLVSAPPAGLLRLAELSRRVDRDFAGISERVGMRDFEGRSFPGWHRHVTLASAAHAVCALAGETHAAAARAAAGVRAGVPATGHTRVAAPPVAGLPMVGYGAPRRSA
ncbi:transposase [Streptomyces venezuelae]|uniref:IS701 family transposase n=1 Tax=Streptomyces venezuelae TaxID=54571 RepID=UPI001CC24527|nr:transposase [Streptomyces venezuelae]